MTEGFSRVAAETADADSAAPSRRAWIGLAALATGLGMIVLDGTIVGVALPTMIRDLRLDLTDAQWVSSLYAVLLAALLLATGKLADRIGRKRLFLAGILVFVGGSLGAATAAEVGTLLSARAVQAIGAALIMPSTLSTVNAVFRGRSRAAAFGVWGAVISGAAALGPLAGGLLTEYASWPWVFLVNLPLGAIVFAVALWAVPETRGSGFRRGADVDGALLSAIGFGALVFAVIEGPDLGWWTPTADLAIGGWVWPATAPISPVPVCLAISAVALTLFVLWERHRDRVQRDALLDLRLFSLRTFSWGNVTAGTVAVGEFALIFVLPLFLTASLGLSVLQTGLVLAAMAFGAFVSGAAARHLAARFGAPGTVLIGLSLEVVGVGGVALVVSPAASAVVLAIPLIVYGLGLGLASAQLTGTVLRDVPVAVSGQASATQSTVRQVGTALGTAFAGAALSMSLAVTLFPAPSRARGSQGPRPPISPTRPARPPGRSSDSCAPRGPRARSGRRRMPPWRPCPRDSPTRRGGRSSWRGCSSPSALRARCACAHSPRGTLRRDVPPVYARRPHGDDARSPAACRARDADPTAPPRPPPE